MNLSVGIVGLPNVGKSTLFNALLSRQVADVSNYPFCTIEPNVGIVEVPDERLPTLAKIVGTEKVVPAVVKFIDIAGLVKDAHKGEGLGNQFLAHIRETDAIVYVLRAFTDDNVIVAGSVDPKSDLKTLQTELILADLQTLGKQVRAKGQATKEQEERYRGIEKLKEALSQGFLAKDVNLSDEEKYLTKDLFLLTSKPHLVVLNVGESDLPRIDTMIQEYKDLDPIPICAKIESDLSELAVEERVDYLKSLNLSESGLEKLISKAFLTLDLIVFFTTVGAKEVRAWPIQKETAALKASGEVHTDFEKGFIKAAVCDYKTFVDLGGWKNAKEAGKVRIEGKDYVMHDGDVVEFFVNQ